MSPAGADEFVVICTLRYVGPYPDALPRVRVPKAIAWLVAEPVGTATLEAPPSVAAVDEPVDCV